jgi:hypothetical protein
MKRKGGVLNYGPLSHLDWDTVISCCVCVRYMRDILVERVLEEIQEINTNKKEQPATHVSAQNRMHN